MEDRVAKTLGGLIKYNNGDFKSEKQAAFLLKQADNGVYTSSFLSWKTTVLRDYHMDQQGVFKVTQHTAKNPKPKTVFTRKSAEEHAADVMLNDRRRALAAEVNKWREWILRAERVLNRAVKHRGDMMVSRAHDHEAMLRVFHRWTAVTNDLEERIQQAQQHMMAANDQLDKTWQKKA